MKGSWKPPQSFAGPSLLETAWERMDDATAAAMAPGASDKVKGEATGMSFIIAIFLNPTNPDAKAVRREAKRRYRERRGQ